MLQRLPIAALALLVLSSVVSFTAGTVIRGYLSAGETTTAGASGCMPCSVRLAREARMGSCPLGTGKFAVAEPTPTCTLTSPGYGMRMVERCWSRAT